MNPRKPGVNEEWNVSRQLLLSDYLLSDDLRQKYKQLKTDEDRFALFLDIIVGHSAALFDSECLHKVPEHSKKMRENGNKSFINSQYYRALQEYTESILYAADSSEELALAYANRSAALIKLAKYEDCIKDIDRALDLQYPERLKTKLYKRKGLCLTELGRPEADSAFQEALNWLDKMSLSQDEMNRSKGELEGLVSGLSAPPKPPSKLIQHPVPEILTPNTELPSASDSVALKYSKERGRHLVATRKIRPGELLVLEKPYCSKLLPKYVYTHCEFCLQVSWAMIPCKYCVHAAYCSEACRNKAWDEYHEMECPLVGMLQGFAVSDTLWVAGRMTIMATRKGMQLDAVKQELINVDSNNDLRTKGFSDDGKFYSDQYRSVYSLPSNAKTCTAIQLISGGLWAAITICALARETKMFGEKLDLNTLAERPDVIFVGALMLKHVHIAWIKTHCYGASERSAAFRQGQVVMALCGLTNHSCDPNTLRQWYADCMALYATYPIEEGEEILDNYGLRYTTMTKSERQEILDRRNVPNCDCVPCTQNWPLLSTIPSYKVQPLTRAAKMKLDKVLRYFAVALYDLVEKGTLENVPNILKEVVKLIEILFPIVRKPCAELTMAAVMLADVYASADNIFNYTPLGFCAIAMQCKLFDNYGPDYTMMTRNLRRAHFARWKFDCECLVCTQNWPLLHDILSFKDQQIIPQNRRKIDQALERFKNARLSCTQKGYRTV